MFYTGAARKPQEYDEALLWVVLLTLAFGIVMVYSASIASAEVDRHSGYRSTFYLVRQAVFVGIGLCFGAMAFQVPSRLLQRVAPYLFLTGALMLLIVLVPGVGREVNGSRRWFPLGVINMQPSEFVKLFVVLYAADFTVRKAAFMDSFKKGFLPMLGIMILTGWLLLREPDLGAFVVIMAIAMAVLFLGGMNWRLFAGLIVLSAVGLALLILIEPYRLQRVLAFQNPWSDPFGKGYQLSHALIAFGRGEWLGVGLGASVEKLLYLPEAHTDFLLAVIAEELGFVGVSVVLVAFGFLVWRAFRIGQQSAYLERYFAALTAYGIGVWFATQGLINMGVNMGVLPTKGLTLPFLSAGGSGLIANCMAVGILLRIDWESKQLMKGVTP
jgi:cell division protein FtsW